MTGQYTELYFPSHNVRYIAIDDGVDSEKGESEIAPFKNIINEWVARDTSRKVKSAFKTKFAEGAYYGDTQPGIDVLKLIATEFNVPIEKLLDMPLQTVCQSCGMPLADASLLGTEADGSPSEHHCKWCYADGSYLGECTMEDMVDICVSNMAGPEAPFTEDEARAYMEALLPTLERWKGAAPADAR